MAQHRVHVRLLGRGDCEHDLCVTIPREVPPNLRCSDAQPNGYGPSGGSTCGCTIPGDLVDQIVLKLRDSLQECRRLGFVPIALR